MIAVREQGISNWSEDPMLVTAEVIRNNKIKRGLRLRFVFIVPMRVVPSLAILNLFNCEAEQEQVLISRFLGHLDGSAIKSAHSQSSIHHKFHIAGSAGLVSRR